MPGRKGKLRRLAVWFAWLAGAREGGAFLREFVAAGFGEARMLRASRTARTKAKGVIAADVAAVR